MPAPTRPAGAAPVDPLAPALQERVPPLVRTRAGRVGVVLFAVAVVAVPLNVGDTFWLGVLNAAGIAALASIGLNVLTGYTGQLSLGHAAFVSIGAFAAQVLGGTLGLPMVVWLPGAAVAAGLVGALVAPFALRLRGPYLAIVSLGLVFVTIYVAQNLPSVTGGTTGTVVTARATLGPVDFTRLQVGTLLFGREQGLFILIWGLVGVVTLLVANLVRSRAGRAMQAVRDQDVAAEVLGVRMLRTQVQAFVTATAIAGLAGGLLAVNLQFIRADNFGVDLSVQYLAIIVIGGMASLWGPVVGALFVTLVPVLVEQFADLLPFMATGGGEGLSTTDLSTVIFGLLIIVFLTVEPAGLMALLRRARSRRRTPAAQPPAPVTPSGSSVAPPERTSR